MKNLISSAIVLAFVSGGTALADQLFDPNFSSGLPTGYTETTNTVPAGTFTTGANGLTVTDFSQTGPGGTGNNTYVSATSATANENIITENFTFTPTYSLTGNGGGQGNIELFALTPFAGSPIFSVVLQPFTYSHTDNLIFNTGVQYNAAATSTGDGYFDSSQGAPALGSLSGKALTVNNVTTTTDLGPDSGVGFPSNFGDRYSIENKGTLYEGSTLLFSYDETRTEDTTNGYDPLTGSLTLQLGIIGGGEDNNANGNYFAPGASITFSSVDVQAPEPSTYALIGLGLAFLLLSVQNRRSLKA